MRALTAREKWMLGLCLGVIFLVVNGFAARSVLKILRGSDAKIKTLENTLADNEMWLDEAPKAEAREKWLASNMPKMTGQTLGKLQGDLIQSLQDDVFNRKLRIDRQSLQDIVYETFYTEVAVRLEVEGAETAVIEWLTTLQGPNQFQIIKDLELELDSRSRELEPQADCEITIARWYQPETGEAIPADGGGTPPAPTGDATTGTEPPAAAPGRVETGS
jgi:hypothetical protein